MAIASDSPPTCWRMLSRVGIRALTPPLIKDRFQGLRLLSDRSLFPRSGTSTYSANLYRHIGIRPLPTCSRGSSAEAISGYLCGNLTLRNIVNTICYDFVRTEEVETAWELERQGFPPEEADNLETLRFHQSVAPELFLGAFIPSSPTHRRLIGYTYATLSSTPRYTQESLTTHEPNATTVCAHTLCVDKEFRGASIGLKLFVEFMNLCKRRGTYDRMVMMAKRRMLPVYERMGFTTVGVAEVILGNEVWYEMSISFRDRARVLGPFEDPISK